MASYKNMKMLWSINIIAKNKLSEREKDLIVELIDNESHKATESRRFVLHDILEKDNILEAVIEGTKSAANNLKKVLVESRFLFRRIGLGPILK